MFSVFFAWKKKREIMCQTCRLVKSQTYTYVSKYISHVRTFSVEPMSDQLQAKVSQIYTIFLLNRKLWSVSKKRVNIFQELIKFPASSIKNSQDGCHHILYFPVWLYTCAVASNAVSPMSTGTATAFLFLSIVCKLLSKLFSNCLRRC